jgi:4-amino-4-deoxy-L-arabinose transferase-like glycosyltransferase
MSAVHEPEAVHDQNATRGPHPLHDTGPAALAVVLLAVALCVLLYGLWTHRTILADQPLWSSRDALEVGLLVLAYGILCAALLAVRALPVRAIAAALLSAYVAVTVGMGPVAAAILILLACLAGGDPIARRLGRDVPAGMRALLSVSMGLALMAMLVGIFAHFPINRPAFYIPVLAIVVAAGHRALGAYWLSTSAWLSTRRPREANWGFLATALLVLILLLQSVRAFLPETGGDGLGMHLVVASQLASHHQWSFDPVAFQWGVYPLASEWILGVGWILGGEMGVRLLSFIFSVIVVLVIVAMSRRFTSTPRALLAGCLFASAGLAFGLTANVYAEPALAAFAVAAFAVATLPRPTWTTWTTVAFGVLCGGCMLTKVTALYLVLPLFVLVIVRLARGGTLRFVLAHAGIAVATTTGISFVPYAFAFWRTGNPVFPLYNDIFRSSLAPAVRESDPRWVGKFSWRLPYQMTLSTSAYCEVYNGTFGFQYLVLTPLALAVAVIRRNWTAIAAFLIALVSAVAVLYSTQYVRYIFPSMAVASIVLAAAFQRGEGRTWKWLSRAACAVGVAVVALNLIFYPGGAWNLPGFQGKALVSDIARQQLLDQQAPERALTAAVNALDGRMARVAYFGRAFAAGLQGTPFFAMNYNPGFEAAVANSKSPDELLRVLRDRQVTYVIAPIALIAASEPLRQVLQLDAAKVAELNGVALYRLNG